MRPILAVIAGYLVMVILVMVTLTLAWTVLGPSFAYQPGTTHVTLAWIGLNLPLSLMAAIAGGYVTQWISASDSIVPVKVLAGVILGVGLIMAVAHLFTDQSAAQQVADSISTEGMNAFAGSSEAVQPAWYNFLIPFIGAGGVLIGSHLRRLAEEEG